MLLRRTRTGRSTHNNAGALVNVNDDDAHPSRCCLGKGKARFALDYPIECRVFKLKKSLSHCQVALAFRNVESIPKIRDAQTLWGSSPWASSLAIQV